MYMHEDKKMLENIQTVAQALGHTPSMAEYEDHPLRKMSCKTFQHHFGSWKKACVKAGLTIRKQQNNRPISKEKIIQNVRKIAKELNRCPLMIEVTKHEKYRISEKTIHKYFGSYMNLVKELGYPAKLHRLNQLSAEKLLLDLYHAILLHPEESSMIRLIQNYTEHSSFTYYKLFGNVKNIDIVLRQKYGLEKSFKYKSKARKAAIWSKQIIEKEFKRIQEEIGKVPSCKDFLKYTQFVGIHNGIKSLYQNYSLFLLSMGYKCHKHYSHDGSVAEAKKQYCIKTLRIFAKQQKNTYRSLPSSQILAMLHFNRREIERIFGSNTKFFQAAAVPFPLSIKKVQHKTDAEIFDKMKKIFKKQGRCPSRKEYQEMPNKPLSYKRLQERFGSYLKAWEMALSS